MDERIKAENKHFRLMELLADQHLEQSKKILQNANQRVAESKQLQETSRLLIRDLRVRQNSRRSAS